MGRINILKNKLDIEKLYELIQDMKSGDQKPFEAGELPDVGKRLGDMERTIDSFVKEVKDELHAMRKGLLEERNLHRLESARMRKDLLEETRLVLARMTLFEQQLDGVRNEKLSCPKDWFQIKNTCYLYVTNTSKTWHGANLACKEFGGILAEPNDAETVDALIEVAKSHTWLGATDEATEGSWVWSGSKEPVTYFKWDQDQPNSFGGDQDCLEILNYWYNDEDCMSDNDYICEKDIRAT